MFNGLCILAGREFDSRQISHPGYLGRRQSRKPRPIPVTRSEGVEWYLTGIEFVWRGFRSTQEEDARRAFNARPFDVTGKRAWPDRNIGQPEKLANTKLVARRPALIRPCRLTTLAEL